MSLVALATDQPNQDTTTFDALAGISAVAMTDDALATVEGQGAVVIDSPAEHTVLTLSGRHAHVYGPGEHFNHTFPGSPGATTFKDGAQSPNYVLTPSGQLAGSGHRP